MVGWQLSLFLRGKGGLQPRQSRLGRRSALACLALAPLLLSSSELLGEGLAASRVEPPRFTFKQASGQVAVYAGDKLALLSPAEGLWSVSCAWQDGWPAEWHHAQVSQMVRSGPWTILRGTLSACGGTWSLEDAYRPQGSLIEGRRRYHWMGPGTAPHVTLSVRFQAVAGAGEVMLPGLLYSGNPAGAKSGKVPVYAGNPGDEAFFEEHRYPEPFAFKELGNLGVALHSLPSPVQAGNLKDQWWSLGMHEVAQNVTELELLSGPTSSNGKRSMVWGVQGGMLPYDNAYLNLPANEQVEKKFYLDAYAVAAKGSGFERSVWQSIDLFQPYSLEALPSFADILEAKYRYAKTRWLSDGTVQGFRKYADRNDIVMGWTGEAEGPGYALMVLAPHLEDPYRARSMASETLDFLSTASTYPGGFHFWWDAKTHSWIKQDLVYQAQAMLGFAHAIRYAREHHVSSVPWERFLRQAAQEHARRILDPAWRPGPTTEAFFIAPLLESSELFHDPQMKRAALKAADYFAARHLSMQQPYWGGTADAECEDKEGAYGAFQGFLYAYLATRDPKYLVWAKHASDVVLSYLVVWDIDLPPGPLRDLNLRTHGWTGVSPQNQHLDVFGSLIAADLYHLGLIENNERLKRIALVMYRTCGQLIDVYGSEGEQVQQTNYTQMKAAQDVTGLRGGYSSGWTVFWTTAHFLNGAAQLEQLGAPLWPSH